MAGGLACVEIYTEDIVKILIYDHFLLRPSQEW